MLGQRAGIPAQGINLPSSMNYVNIDVSHSVRIDYDAFFSYDSVETNLLYVAESLFKRNFLFSSNEYNWQLKYNQTNKQHAVPKYRFSEHWRKCIMFFFFFPKLKLRVVVIIVEFMK